MMNTRPSTLPVRISGQRGAIAIVVALSLVVMLGMLGLAIDGGRLYVNQAELQSAADSCALAAAAELVCDGVGICPTTYLQNAEAAGQLSGQRNKANLQAGLVSISAADILFNTTLGPNSGYLSRAGGASPNSRFAMCKTRTNGITPWLMGLLGIGASNVNATGVATLAPGQTFCSAAPIGVCKKPGGVAPNYGYAVGEWISSNFASGGGNDNVTGGFQWVDFTPNAGGANETRDQLYGRGQACSLTAGGNVQTNLGAQQGAKFAYNTRFGLYQNGANAETAATAPPDRTGYAYPNKNPGSPLIGVGTSAYADYRARQSSNTAFTQNQYNGGNPSGNVNNASDYLTYGTERRLIPVAMIDCTAGNTVPILSMACILMLNPMGNGANGTLYTEYRGPANSSTSPCRSSGLPGGGGGSGPLVPTLVQ